MPYWGGPQERRILRQFWDNSDLHQKSSSFHLVITSYQIVIMDFKHLNRIKWQHLVLDEAQAIKSSSRFVPQFIILIHNIWTFFSPMILWKNLVLYVLGQHAIQDFKFKSKFNYSIHSWLFSAIQYQLNFMEFYGIS